MIKFRKQEMVALGCMALNLFSSISIVFTNKYVYEFADFKFGTTLTLVHFLVTFLGLNLCRLFGVFKPVKLDIKPVAKLSLAFCGFVVLTNISLQYNSVAFYQVMKVLTTPYIVIIQSYYGQTFSLHTKMALITICLGAAITSGFDYQANLTGFLIALLAVAVTSHYQMWVGDLQKQLECNSMQLLYYQVPLSAFFLLFAIPILDDFSGLMAYELDSFRIGIIFFSGVVAFFVNLSIFLVIGKASPVTYNVLGHCKLSLIIIGGFVLFGAPVIWNQIYGILIALVGVGWYTYIKLKGIPSNMKSQASSSNVINVKNPIRTNRTSSPSPNNLNRV